MTALGAGTQGSQIFWPLLYNAVWEGASSSGAAASSDLLGSDERPSGRRFRQDSLVCNYSSNPSEESSCAVPNRTLTQSKWTDLLFLEGAQKMFRLLQDEHGPRSWPVDRALSRLMTCRLQVLNWGGTAGKSRGVEEERKEQANSANGPRCRRNGGSWRFFTDSGTGENLTTRPGQGLLQPAHYPGPG
jgi:hypothetical protein